MNRLLSVIAVIGLVFASGCYKDEVDIATLNNNPFDPGFTGPNVFSFDTTYTEQIPGIGAFRQVFQFKVNSALFLRPQAYDVFVVDPLASSSTTVHQVPAGSDVLRYYRLEYTVGQEVCLQLSLSNNTHEGRAETVCGTLQ